MRPRGVDRIVRRALLVWVIACLGCEDRITGPEAVSIVNALERSLTRDSVLRQWWLGNAAGYLNDLAPVLRSPAAAANVTVHKDGKPMVYRAIVFDRLVIPPSADLSPQGECRFAPKRSLVLWRLDSLEDLVLAGQDFEQQMAQGPPICWGDSVWVPPPTLRWSRLAPDSSGREQPEWLATGGRGNITPAQDAGDCGLAEDDAQMLLDEVAVTCRRTLHRVRFRATLAPFGPDGPGKQSRTVELRETEVPGVRYTLHCDDHQHLRVCSDPGKFQGAQALGAADRRLKEP